MRSFSITIVQTDTPLGIINTNVDVIINGTQIDAQFALHTMQNASWNLTTANTTIKYFITNQNGNDFSCTLM